MHIIILAAGNGTRMNSEMPKALAPLHGRPIISYVLESVQKSGVCANPTVVVSSTNEKAIREAIGAGYHFVAQNEQLGTGHAVSITRAELEDQVEGVLVLYCDMPLISPESLQRIAEEYEKTKAAVTLITVNVPDFEGWHAGFENFSRAVRNDKGDIIKVVERRDLDESEFSIKETVAYLCVDTRWAWHALTKIKNDNAKGEYYLTDLVRLAVEEKKKIASVSIFPKEALGINTQEQLTLVQELTEEE